MLELAHLVVLLAGIHISSIYQLYWQKAEIHQQIIMEQVEEIPHPELAM
jgi:hypothetical protein